LIAHDVLPEGPKARILLGFDASEGAGLGLEAIVQFLDPARCSVKVLTIGDEPFPPIDFWPMPLGTPLSHVDAEATRARRRHDAEGRAGWAADEIRASGFERHPRPTSATLVFSCSRRRKAATSISWSLGRGDWARFGGHSSDR
jgi:hypothetical protein